MPIHISIADGSFGGQPGGGAFVFPDDKAMVTVGRHPSCDVVFPSDLIAVSRYHLAFERKLARYRLIMQADNPVWIDGEEAFEGDELPLAAVVTLGHPDGPALRVETIEDDDLPLTERYARHLSPGRLAGAADRISRDVRRLVVALGAVVAVVAVALGWAQWEERRELAQLLSGAYHTPAAGTEEQLAARLREAAPSVVLVAVEDPFGISPIGTAWVVAPGVLATNAHVADRFRELPRGGRLVVRLHSGPAKTIAVRAVTFHPDFQRFEEAWRAYGPVSAGAGGESRTITDAGAYDVALLHVADRDAGTLGPALPIAPDADLDALEPGNLVGYVGFPVESAAVGGVNIDDPQPQLQIGRLTALTDFFLVKSETADRQLLQHSLPVQGGASGSPVLDHRGQVVGVLSGGNLIEIDGWGTRVPSGVGVNFAQRADLVRELLSGADPQRAAERGSTWQRRLTRYQTEVDIALQDWAASHGAARPPTPILSVDGRTAPRPDLDVPAFVVPYTIAHDGWHLFLATARDHANIDMMVIEKAAKGPQLLGQDTAPDHYPGVEVPAHKDSPVEVIVPGPLGTDVHLRVYWLPTRP